MLDNYTSRAASPRAEDMAIPTWTAWLASSRDQPHAAPVSEVSGSCV